jgi:antitoxin (DNA-binding transcriptional repressor) of toxin-antitoxin stability system
MNSNLVHTPKPLLRARKTRQSIWTLTLQTPRFEFVVTQPAVSFGVARPRKCLFWTIPNWGQTHRPGSSERWPSVRVPQRRLRTAESWIATRSTRCYGAVMSRTITQRELRNESGEIMRLLDQGETFTVTRNGVPVGELAPLRRHRFVAADTAIARFRNAPHIDAHRFRTDLDAIADQDSNPRA